MANQKAIGPTFYSELQAAGFTGQPGGISWDASGTINYAANITPAQAAIVQQVYAAHDPTKQLPPATS